MNKTLLFGCLFGGLSLIGNAIGCGIVISQAGYATAILPNTLKWYAAAAIFSSVLVLCGFSTESNVLKASAFGILAFVLSFFILGADTSQEYLLLQVGCSLASIFVVTGFISWIPVTIFSKRVWMNPRNLISFALWIIHGIGVICLWSSTEDTSHTVPAVFLLKITTFVISFVFLLATFLENIKLRYIFILLSGFIQVALLSIALNNPKYSTLALSGSIITWITNVLFLAISIWLCKGSWTWTTWIYGKKFCLVFATMIIVTIIGAILARSLSAIAKWEISNVILSLIFVFITLFTTDEKSNGFLLLSIGMGLQTAGDMISSAFAFEGAQITEEGTRALIGYILIIIGTWFGFTWCVQGKFTIALRAAFSDRLHITSSVFFLLNLVGLFIIWSFIQDNANYFRFSVLSLTHFPTDAIPNALSLSITILLNSLFFGCFLTDANIGVILSNIAFTGYLETYIVGVIIDSLADTLNKRNGQTGFAICFIAQFGMMTVAALKEYLVPKNLNTLLQKATSETADVKDFHEIFRPEHFGVLCDYIRTTYPKDDEGEEQIREAEFKTKTFRGGGNEETKLLDEKPTAGANYSRNNLQLQVKKVVTPRNKTELKQAIQEAFREEWSVRATGTSWAWSEICHTDGLLIVMDQYLKNQIDLDSKTLQDPTDKKLLQIEAGATIYDVNNILQNVNQTIVNSTGYDRLNLIGTSCAGAHGSGLAPDIGAMCSMFRAFNIITIDKKTKEVIELQVESKMAPLSDPEAFKAKHRDEIKLIQNDDLFLALGVNGGMLGVIYSVVIRTIQNYWTSETRTMITWDELKVELPKLLNGAENLESFEMWINPYPVLGKVQTVISKYTKVPPQARPCPSCKNCCPCVISPCCCYNVRPLAIRDETLVKIAGWAAVEVANIPALNILVPGVLQAALQATLDTDVQQPVRDSRDFGAANVAVPVEVTTMGVEVGADGSQCIKAVEDLIKYFQERAKTEKAFITSPFSLRFTNAVPYFIAPEYSEEGIDLKGAETDSKSKILPEFMSSNKTKFVMIESPILRGTKKAVDTCAGFRRTMTDSQAPYTARDHWGLLNDYTSEKYVRSKFPQWDKFAEVFSILNWHKMNSNILTRKLGLDSYKLQTSLEGEVWG